MVFTADGTVAQVELGVETMLSKQLRIPLADVEATATAAAVPAAGAARRLADQQFTVDFVVSFSDLATATAAHTALGALDAAAAATVLKAELTAAGGTVPATFMVTKTEEAPASLVFTLSALGSRREGTSGSAEADETFMGMSRTAVEVFAVVGLVALALCACGCCVGFFAWATEDN
mmetsp:Transcript_90805/g.207830  ORF Transcript_90805/g.207830 Transcript_90805/m.207830 type:complete len:177 (+) Transcript_90805:395-925(+)